MKLETLEVGQTFKNYKGLCEALGIEVKVGTKGKKYQLEELLRYCNYTKLGHQFIIKEIYETPLPKTENRGKSEGSRNNNSVYGNLIKCLITDKLAQSKGHISISRGWLMLSIGMVNENYNECGQYVRKLSKYTEMDEQVIYDFYNINNGNFKNAIETALKQLMNQRIIMYNTVIKVCRIGEEYTQPETATEIELAIIMDCETEIFEEMGYYNISAVRVSKDWKKFKSKVKYLLSKNSDIKYYYTAYDITINENYIEKERNKLIDLLLEAAKRKEYKDDLNQSILDNVLKNAQIRHEKEKLKGIWGTTSNKKADMRRSESYIEDIKRLANLLIDKNTPSFIQNVKSIKIETLPQDLLDDIEQMLLFG